MNGRPGTPDGAHHLVERPRRLRRTPAPRPGLLALRVGVHDGRGVDGSLHLASGFGNGR
ncbi:hypothetical protein ACGFY7_03135 [Streptomyces prunicolor]|uniref:hypothetical protein n=1 Tax=Streptomyces prunicolor TaxID=67348 RepID=UPI003710A0CA